MAKRAPGQSASTAWAMTCAVEWRRTSRPSSLSAVTMRTFAPSCSGAPRSASSPSTSAATAAAGEAPSDRRGEVGAGRPARQGTARDPSGRTTVISLTLRRSQVRCYSSGCTRARALDEGLLVREPTGPASTSARHHPHGAAAGHAARPRLGATADDAEQCAPPSRRRRPRRPRRRSPRALPGCRGRRRAAARTVLERRLAASRRSATLEAVLCLGRASSPPTPTTRR